MRSVRHVLGRLPGGRDISLDEVRSLMRRGKSFRYLYDHPYVATYPDITESRRAGDCKDKALWLANRIGDHTIRYVVGKAYRGSPSSHAWLMWQKDGRYWVLDCTNQSQPIPVDRISSHEYIPYYSWSKRGVFRHKEAPAR